MAYNLPPAWDPGYAYPPTVRAEGLQRRAFITKQMPRGTYYQSSVGEGSYANTPQYVTDEGYGQGTLTTRWQPSGTYSGPRVPHWLNVRPKVMTDQSLPGGGQAITMASPAIGMPANEGQAISMGSVATVVKGIFGKIFGPGPIRTSREPGTALHGMGGIAGEPAMPDPFPSFGQQAATHILSRMNALPKPQRAKYLTNTLNKIDPTLAQRTGQIAIGLRRQGMNTDQALHAGLSRAMTAGFLAELTLKGAGKAKAGALSGCCGYLGGMGDVPAARKRSARRSAGRRGHRTALADTPTMASSNLLKNTTAVSSQAQVSAVQDPGIQVGPFKFNPNIGPYITKLTNVNQIPTAWKAWLAKQLTTPTNDDGSYNMNWQGSQMVGPMNAKGITYQGPTYSDWFNAIGIKPTDTVDGAYLSFDQTLAATQDWNPDDNKAVPIARFRSDGSTPPTQAEIDSETTIGGGGRGNTASSADQITDKDWGVWIWVESPPLTNIVGGTATQPPTVLNILFDRMPQTPWWQGIWDFITWLPTQIAAGFDATVDAVAAAVGAVADLACAVVTSPGAASAATAAAGKGNPGTAVAAGAGTTVAAALCGGTQVPTCPAGYVWNGTNQCIPIATGPNYLPWLLLGGGALIAIAAAKKSNKRKAAASSGGTK